MAKRRAGSVTAARWLRAKDDYVTTIAGEMKEAASDVDRLWKEALEVVDTDPLTAMRKLISMETLLDNHLRVERVDLLAVARKGVNRLDREIPDFDEVYSGVLARLGRLAEDREADFVDGLRDLEAELADTDVPDGAWRELRTRALALVGRQRAAYELADRDPAAAEAALRELRTEREELVALHGRLRNG